MESLVELHEKLAEADSEEMYKLAEEDAAGRIMARGFWDEFSKLAGGLSAGLRPGATIAPGVRTSPGAPTGAGAPPKKQIAFGGPPAPKPAAPAGAGGPGKFRPGGTIASAKTGVKSPAGVNLAPKKPMSF